MPACSAAGVLAVGATFGLSGIIGAGADLLTVLNDAFFYCSVREYIMDDIIQGPYRELVAQKLAMALGVMSTVIMTIWVSYQGFQIITGANRNPIVPLFIQTGKMVLILSLVGLVAANSPVIVDWVGNFKNLISQAVANGADITILVDLNLGITSLLNSITESMKAVDNGKDPNTITTTVGLIGQSGPAMLVAVLLMLSELSVTLAIMLAPLFIFFLLFQQTTALFWSWAKFVLGALFSMATLTLIGALVLKATAIYGGSVVVAYYGGLLSGTSLFDISGSSLRLAALGALMSAIIMAIPHTIMQFFGAGAGFAAGAFGFAGAGAVAGSLGAAKGLGTGAGFAALGQNQPQNNGATVQAGSGSQPGNAPGQIGGSQSLTQSGYSGSSNGGVYSAQSAIGRFNSEASQMGSESDASMGPRNVAGSRGLANDSGFTGFQSVRQNQNAMQQSGELRRDGSMGNPPTGNHEVVARDAQDMTLDEKRGVYTTPSTDAVLAGSAGRGGDLRVSGSDTSVHAADKVLVAKNEAQPARPTVPYGNNGNTRAT
ncbi:type IV secretion system protein [Hydrogenophaga sp. SL48]|uniref:type IV secretion system protein n=1 Tax=Hydrogenophaga sp. SL48 TaxID=2806347 RepID=UPI001F336A0D|nr:type IV secretion system protein [Hydrogenophaga sp. SL48]UJW82386.1 type IV secretion system protein [Hydrogenophaga sp. SL48]